MTINTQFGKPQTQPNEEIQAILWPYFYTDHSKNGTVPLDDWLYYGSKQQQMTKDTGKDAKQIYN